jgi:hypothetical protein
MNPFLVHQEVDAAADQGVRNSQPEGLGRVVALRDLVCWNNLGRNVVFADRQLRPRAVFGTTLFPDEDEPSQYDLDVHAILEVPEFGLIVVLNHFGAVRTFRAAEIQRGEGHLLPPAALWWFVADVERTVVLAGRLVGSAPRSEGAMGLVVSPSLDAVTDGERPPVHRTATGFGEVTALGVVPSSDGPLVSLGGEAKVALAPFVNGRVGTPRWETAIGFRAAVMAWHGDLLWVAGPDGGSAVDDYDWERLSGGAFVALDPVDGQPIMGGPLPEDVAWGTGGVAVAPLGHWLAAVGRTGRLHLVDPRREAGGRTTEALAAQSLGIAHLAVSGDAVCCGFNRGGYRLHAFRSSGETERGGRA